MAQSRTGSIIETVCNTFIGWFVSLVANLIIFPWYGFQVTLSQAFSIGVIYTGISIVRGYFVRRAFNTAPARRLFDH